MNLPEFQRILARIVTTPGLGERFLDNPEVVAVSEGWDANLARLLATIPPHQLRQYGESLVNKRSRVSASYLPLTFKALGDSRFRALFRDHARVSTPQGPARHRDDAIAFAEKLRSERPEAPKHPAWLADLAAYEAASLLAGIPGRRFSVVRLRYSPRDIAEAALSGKTADNVPRRFSLIVWIRLTRMGPSRQFRLAIPQY
jgi:hypothetical protein